MTMLQQNIGKLFQVLQFFARLSWGKTSSLIRPDVRLLLIKYCNRKPINPQHFNPEWQVPYSVDKKCWSKNIKKLLLFLQFFARFSSRKPSILIQCDSVISVDKNATARISGTCFKLYNILQGFLEGDQHFNPARHMSSVDKSAEPENLPPYFFFPSICQGVKLEKHGAQWKFFNGNSSLEWPWSRQVRNTSLEGSHTS